LIVPCEVCHLLDMTRATMSIVLAGLLTGLVATPLQAVTARFSCRDGAHCDLDNSCDGSCLIRYCGVTSLRVCGRRNKKALEMYPQQLVAGEVERYSSRNYHRRVRCRPATARCNKPPARVCTLTLGPPVARTFNCHATLARSERDSFGVLFVSLRGDALNARAQFRLPQATSGSWNLAGTDYNGGMDGLEPLGFSSFHADRFTAGTGYDADITVDSAFDGGVSEVRGSLRGTLAYGTTSEQTLVTFSVDF